jgi:hypothetical protein
MKKLTAIVLALCFLAHFSALRLPTADVDGNGRVELKDAILAVRGLQNASEKNDLVQGPGFNTELKKALEAFQTVAGEKTLTTRTDAKPATSSTIAAVHPASNPVPAIPVSWIGSLETQTPLTIVLDLSTPPPKSAGCFYS